MLNLSTKQKILEQLNEEQKKPVIDYYGPSIVIAAPGSGKTFTIVSRLAYMIEEDINPSNILMFTFTRKGANEIRERVASYIGQKSNGITICTYHSFCMNILKKYADILGWKRNFSIYDEEDKTETLKKIVNNVAYSISGVSNLISDYKEKMISPSMAKSIADSEYYATIAEYYNQYQLTLKRQNAFDFDDLIYFVIRLFEKYPEILKNVNNKYKYIISDESQDSSARDCKLITLLGGKQMNICLVMDDEQGIYGFRGASIKSVFKLIESINFKHFTLGKNYRSTKTIVAAARSVIENNLSQLKKTVFTDNPQGDDVICYTLPDINSEAIQIVKIIKALTRCNSTEKEKIRLKDIAILYRMSYLSRPIEEYLLRNSIKYTVVGGSPFYSRKEIKDIMAYIRFSLNSDDQQAFQRIINTPKRKIGDKALEQLFHCLAMLNHVNIEDDNKIIKACYDTPFKGAAKKGMDNFLSIIEQLKKLIAANCTPKCIIAEILRLTNYLQYLSLDKDNEKAEERIANVMELKEIASSYETVEDFLDNMAINNVETENDSNQDCVNLLTMHSSKGLEFPVVIIAGANEGIVPHYKANTTEKLEEERRLFYVSMTRAKNNLFITRSKVMLMNGMPYHYKSSRFVNEIDSEYIRKF